MKLPDKTTIKIRTYADRAAGKETQSNLSEEQNNALELIKKTVQLQEEKSRSLEQLKKIEHLQESLNREQAKTAEMANRISALEARLKELAGRESDPGKVAGLEAKVKELSELLGTISGMATAGKTV